MIEARIEPHASIDQELPANYNAFVVVLEGDGTIGSSSAAVRAGEVAWLTRSDESSAVALTAGNQGLRVVLFGGLPLREPVVARGPFVMNTTAELNAAFAELRAQGAHF